jgi:hypothetical protein
MPKKMQFVGKTFEEFGLSCSFVDIKTILGS